MKLRSFAWHEQMNHPGWLAYEIPVQLGSCLSPIYIYIPNQPGGELITAHFELPFRQCDTVTHVSPFCWCFPRNLSCGVPISTWTSWQSSPFPQRTGSAMRKKSRCTLASWFIFDWCLIKWVVPVMSLNANMPNCHHEDFCIRRRGSRCGDASTGL